MGVSNLDRLIAGSVAQSAEHTVVSRDVIGSMTISTENIFLDTPGNARQLPSSGIMSSQISYSVSSTRLL